VSVSVASSTVASADLLDLLLISDQIGSSGVGVEVISRQIQEHFEGLPGCIFGITGLHDQETSVIKNIGDSLMIRVVCDKSTLPILLSRLVDMLHELKVRRARGTPVLLRILIMQLVHEKEEYLKGESLNLPNNKIAGNFRGSNGSLKTLKKWLKGDLFGPRINLAFRAASISVKVPVVIIEDSLAECLFGEGELSFDGFDVNRPGSSTLTIGPRLAFSPIKGLEERYPFAVETNTGWPGHLFLRTVNKKALETMETEDLDALSLEQQSYKSFARFMWLGLPKPEDISYWVRVIQKSQGGALYFRSLLYVIAEAEVHRSRENVGQTIILRPGDGRSNMYTGMIGVFAAPFESTYELIRGDIFAKQRARGENTQFRYPISTIVYNPTEQDSSFLGNEDAECPWRVIVFWRWLPEHRTIDETQCKNLVGALEDCRSPELTLRARRKGMIVGGEWDGYAVFRPREGSPAALLQPKDVGAKFEGFTRHLMGCVGKYHVESMAVYFCCHPEAAPVRADETR